MSDSASGSPEARSARTRVVVGAFLGVAGLGAAVLNLIAVIEDQGVGVFGALTEPTVWAIGLAGAVVLVSVWIERLRILQVVVVFLMGYGIAAFNDPGDLTGFIYVLLGLLLAYEYQLLGRRPLIPTTILAAAYTAVSAAGMVVVHASAPVQFIGAFLGAAALGGVAWGVTFLRVREHEQREQQLERTVQERTQQLEESLREYKLLLAELHHRTKNNLQMVSSILAIDDSRADPDGLEATVELRHRRINALARVHDQLYSATGGGTVDLALALTEYLGDAATMADTHRFGITGSVKLAREVTADLALRVAVIVNEIAMNAIDAGRRFGDASGLHVAATEDNGALVLVARTDGIQQSDAVRETASMGAELIVAMTERLGGQAKRLDDAGTSWELRIPLDFGLTKWDVAE